MIRHYTTIRSEFKDANIYVWDVGTKCLYAFAYLACRGIDVKGFVSNIEEYIGGSICNRPILSPEEFAAEEDGIIIVHDDVGSEIFRMVCGFGKAYRYSAVMGIDEALQDTAYYLYGTDNQAWQMLKELSARRMRLRGFVVPGAGEGQQLMGVPVHAPEDIPADPQIPVIIPEKLKTKSPQMLDIMCKSGFQGDIYVREILPDGSRWGTNPFRMLSMAAHEQKKLLLCCEGRRGSEWLHSVLDMYGFEIAREVCLEGEEDRGVEDIWSLADEDPGQCVLLFFAPDPAKRADIIEAAKDLGFTEEDGNYACIQEGCYNRAHLEGPLLYERDNRMLFSLDYSPVGGLPGWAVYGNPETAEKRILVLGGSTSSEVYVPENWISGLHRLCAEHGVRAAIYNGAYEGNMVMDELIRLTRGLQRVRPDIVISMSGVNDFNAAANKFEAHPGENNVEYWRRIESYMKAITEAEGGVYFAFVQPINTFVRGSVDEALMFTAQAHFDNRKGARTQLSPDDFYCNMWDLLEHREDLYFDLAHYTGPGHEMIARRVFETIKGALT